MRRKYLVLIMLAIPILAWQGAEKLLYPSWFPPPAYDFQKHPLDSATILLGRILFYDPILSADSTVSCASCHAPFNAFAHTDHSVSHGIGDQTGDRNAPALMNLAWQSSFMWDGAIASLDVQALAPITHPKEMGANLGTILQRLRTSLRYQKMFSQAYGDTMMTTQRLLTALAQFQLTFVSADSRYDRVMQGRDSFSAQEKKGYRLFQLYCNQCHTEPLFTNGLFANNGLSIDTFYNDYGRFRVTQRASDSLLFKVPTLRNLSFSYPYMHDGRFNKLQQVLNHYASEKMPSSTRASALQKPFPLSAEDKVDLISFLLMLNDRSFVFNPAFQFPKEILLGSEGK